MNLRNALFPLIVIVLLVYLAGETLMGGGEEQKLPYSEVQRLVFAHPERVDELTFRPNERKVVLKLTNGTTIRADYARAATPPAFEPPMAQGAASDSNGKGSFWSRWAISPLLLFVPFLLIALWANRRQSRISNEDLRAS